MSGMRLCEEGRRRDRRGDRSVWPLLAQWPEKFRKRRARSATSSCSDVLRLNAARYEAPSSKRLGCFAAFTWGVAGSWGGAGSSVADELGMGCTGHGVCGAVDEVRTVDGDPCMELKAVDGDGRYDGPAALMDAGEEGNARVGAGAVDDNAVTPKPAGPCGSADGSE